MIRSSLLGSGLAALALALAAPAHAQPAAGAAERLSQHLRDLARDPTSLPALIGAGEAALGVGDSNAALGFFARADEQAPRNGRVKAGLARALLMNDNPRDALRMFEAATALGVPEADIAGDRGLAFDLRGDQRRAQRDYAIALQRGGNDEVTRRYALSLAISGDRAGALKLLDPLLYKRDQAAWRARAFVLALTGDLPAANQIVGQVMPERMAALMTPFMARLATLKPAEKAAAVHLGEMPADGVRMAGAEADAQVAAMAPMSQAARLAPVIQSTPAPDAAPKPAPAAVEPRGARRRGRAAPPAAAPAPAPAPPPPPPPPAMLAGDALDPVLAGSGAAGAGRGPAALPAARRGDLDAIMADIRAAARADRESPLGTSVRRAAPVAAAPETEAPAPRVAEARKPDSAKPDPKKPDPKKPDPKKPDPKKAEARKKPEPKVPPRIWVQVAGGANRADMPKEWKRLTGQAPAALKGRQASLAPGRLLVGPFKSDGEAQDFVRTLRKSGVGAFQWDSPAGADVRKLGAK
ncbi:tetratricopeptide repeat protein [Sphingomonas changnyeongensis]|uniref:Tetratricopeptide repeat protein n=1 Tax=Sphingomonas changnyeongensis TaxID=2698679 RepID=A0A7Z2NTL2_9SPHN|nr:SPOR domain-containing protein [Sphingomonas changnyeongensis]QHL89588.1 tetratricopeptide repeat protein [Sphingomonas changnyeongensis]